jgi:hypothetical protein
MKAIIQSWSVNQSGPAMSTRREYRNEHGEIAAVSYEAINEVSLRLTVIGNDGIEFVKMIESLANGATLNEIKINKADGGPGRKYIFE